MAKNGNDAFLVKILGSFPTKDEFINQPSGSGELNVEKIREEVQTLE